MRLGIFPRRRHRFVSAAKRQRRETWKRRFRIVQVPAIQLAMLIAVLSLVRFRGPVTGAIAVLLALGTIALAAVIGVSKARRQQARELQQAETAVNLQEAVSGANTVSEAYSRLMHSISRRFHSRPVCLLIRDETDCRFRRAAWSYGPEADVTVETLWLAHNSFVVRRLARLSEPWKIEPKDLAVWLQAAEGFPPEAREAREKECKALRLMATSMLVRISSHDELIGILSLAKPEHASFSAQDSKALKNIAAQLALVIENSRLLDRVVQHKRVEQELALAARVQRNLLPSKPPVAAGLEAAAFCRPAREVGGDYYDFVVLEDGTLAFAIGDVAGKGISAAMLMAAVQASLRSQLIEYDVTRRAPARMLASMNRLLARNSAPEQFVTFFAGFVSADRKRFVYVNAGHNAPLLFHRNNGKASIERPVPLDRGGPVLGVLPDFVYEEGALELRDDDLLVAYTDGLSEAMNAAGEEFTEEQIIQTVAMNPDWSAAATADALQTQVRLWSAGAPQHDDITCVVLRAASAS